MEVTGIKKMKSGPGGVPGEEEKNHLGGLTQSTSASQHLVELRHDPPTDPCRGLGRKLLARTRHRDPVEHKREMKFRRGDGSEL